MSEGQERGKNNRGSLNTDHKDDLSRRYKFGHYIKKDQVNAAIHSGQAVEGCLRISRKNFLDAYVNLMSGEQDVYIDGVLNRNAALEGDMVIVKLFTKDKWKILSEEVIGVLTENESLAEDFLKTYCEDVFNHWQYDKSVRENEKLEPASSCDVQENEVVRTSNNTGSNCNVINSTNLPSDTSTFVDKAEAPLGIDKIIAGLNDVNIAAEDISTINNSSGSNGLPSKLNKDNNCAEPTTLPSTQVKVQELNDIVNFHKEVLDKVQMECNRMGVQDITSVSSNKSSLHEYILNMTDTAANKQRGNSNTRPNKFPEATAVNVIIMCGLLSVENVYKYPQLGKFVQKTGEVIHIADYVHPRHAIGILKPHFKNKEGLFSPTDSRIPRMKIPVKDCPPDLWNHPEDYRQTLFLVKIVEWSEPGMARGHVTKVVGSSQSFEVEKQALLIEHTIDDGKFIKSDLKEIQLENDITEKELEGRKDLRDLCIFTIDPSTAKDLDDAVSCVPLSNGNFEVGVHIADVTHYVEAGSKIDKIAASRATTFYLTDQVVPMLPPLLSERVCSLDAGKDKLTFSVIWELDKEGTKLGEWMGKTVITSCCKLSYEHAQTMIDNQVENLRKKNFPKIHRKIRLLEIHSCIRNLNKLAISLRKGRLSRGSLRLDQGKFGLVINPKSKVPEEIYFCGLQESNKLIEEFMLLANISVANKIYSHFPKLSVLRHHLPPHLLSLESMCKVLKLNGVSLDINSSGSLSASLERYRGQDEASKAIYYAVVSLCSKPMQIARYFCSGMMQDKQSFHHYALNESIYTHFTSPIRRYADIMVHRLLSSAVHPEKYLSPNITASDLQKQASHCNNKKKSAKAAQEASTEIHLAEYIQLKGPVVENAVVVGVLNKAFDVLLIRYGIVKRCYCDQIPIKKFEYKPNRKPGILVLTWIPSDEKSVTQEISLFEMVNVRLEVNEKLKIVVRLICPEESEAVVIVKDI